jgi:hypothetical protein
MGPQERDPEHLIANGMLEKIEDFQHQDVAIPASRLGYRITRKFVRSYMARVFDNPDKVFSDELLKPELQDLESFADGVLYIAEAQQRVASQYFSDGGYELACPPLQAILNIMAHGQHQGKSIDDPEIRQIFTRDSLLNSDWYQRRLREKKVRDIEHWRSFEIRLNQFMASQSRAELVHELKLRARLEYAREMRSQAESAGYEQQIVGTLGADPMRPSTKDATLVDRLAGVQP